jgi:alkylated DNA repair dioxygenase AlkB
MLTRKDLSRRSWIDHDPDFLDPIEGSALLATLLETVAWERRPVVYRELVVEQPRLVGWGGELPYRYSGATLDPRPLTPELSALRDRVATACGVAFNHVVCNRYRDGRDHMAVHADNEPELGYEPVIAALSLGATREFRLELRHKRHVKRTLMLRHGSLFVMGGALQHQWRHSVPKMGPEVGERVNITFRLLHGPPGWRHPRWQAAIEARAATAPEPHDQP